MIELCTGGFGPLCAWCDQFDKDGGEPMGPNHWWCAYPNRRSRTFDVLRQVLTPSVSDELVWKITIFTAPPRRCAAGDSLSPCAAGELLCAANWGRRFKRVAVRVETWGLQVPSVETLQTASTPRSLPAPRSALRRAPRWLAGCRRALQSVACV